MHATAAAYAWPAAATGSACVTGFTLMVASTAAPGTADASEELATATAPPM